MIEAGSRVAHPRYGRGVVTSLRAGGYELLVTFDSTLRLWLPARELERRAAGRDRTIAADTRRHQRIEAADAILDEIMGSERFRTAPDRRPREEPGATAPSSAAASFDAARYRPRPLDRDPAHRPLRLALEAFRLGIVPGHAIRRWTVGRDAEVRHVFGWLSDPSSGSLVVEGAYGSGKTHVLELLRAEALDRQWAVALVGIDPTDAPAGFPKRVYRNAIADLRIPVGGEIVGLPRILDLLSALPADPIADHPLWSVVHRLWRERPELREALVAYLAGRPVLRKLPGLPHLPDHTTAANVYCNLLSSLSGWLAESIGLRGLLLLVDEAEMSRTVRYSYEWSRGVNFFNGLAWMADDDDLLESEALVRRNCYRGAKSGLVYSGFVKWPYIHRIPSHFKVVFAFTHGYTRFFSHVHAENLVQLDLPERRDLLELFERLAETYRSLYGLGPMDPRRRACAEAVVDSYSQSFRFLIKGFVELLDHWRFYPEGEPDAVLGCATGVG